MPDIFQGGLVTGLADKSEFLGSLVQVDPTAGRQEIQFEACA